MKVEWTYSLISKAITDRIPVLFKLLSVIIIFLNGFIVYDAFSFLHEYNFIDPLPNDFIIFSIILGTMGMVCGLLTLRVKKEKQKLLLISGLIPSLTWSLCIIF